jgi:hypothetical protein
MTAEKFNVGDTVVVTTDRLAPWLGQGAIARIAEAYPEDDQYVIDFAGFPDDDGSDDLRAFILHTGELREEETP